MESLCVFTPEKSKIKVKNSSFIKVQFVLWEFQVEQL
jgi:hypothetical protein